MSSAFLKMKKDRQKLSQKRMDKVKNESNGGASYKDDRLYYPERDSNGNGYAVIRFLAARDPDALPYTKVFEHGFKVDGGWYIENCPTTIGKECPACKSNSEAWQRGDKTTARNRKRNKKYYANIYVVSDSKNPDNEGKVFLFKFGQAIFDILLAASQPEFEDEKPIDPFDLWDGANMKLKIVKKDGQTNYDRSEFDSPGPLSDDDEEIERIWSQQYDLSEFTAPEAFKDYDVLAKRFARVTGGFVSDSAEDVEEDEAPTRRSSSRNNSTPTVSEVDEDENLNDIQGVDDELEDDPVAWFESQSK